jgi:hypothetical protein
MSLETQISTCPILALVPILAAHFQNWAKVPCTSNHHFSCFGTDASSGVVTCPVLALVLILGSSFVPILALVVIFGKLIHRDTSDHNFTKFDNF